VQLIREKGRLACRSRSAWEEGEIFEQFKAFSKEEEEAITSSSHIRLIRWTQPVSRNRSRNTNESQ